MASGALQPRKRTTGDCMKILTWTGFKRKPIGERIAIRIWALFIFAALINCVAIFRLPIALGYILAGMAIQQGYKMEREFKRIETNGNIQKARYEAPRIDAVS